ncbi:MAG: COX15/CtaA family protein [Sinobacteraceae bacterium]|nr:COX15/CtaA family protein [Nevskiaceae bacterium]MCP5340367.1 COX15/CtaA family protein [Nevskiaceae bacterium]MCP5466783.1 COX15/CtaA family protein [Nevskiaceae bacterium]MCP5470584.1 COX15/CtaA family protein [Nevskiaceae bacterium]
MNATPSLLVPAALPAATLIRRLALFGVALCLTVVVLGAWVRLTDAGLGCPDWPTCYGHVTPSGAMQNPGQVESYSPGWAFDSGKAWREMIHRYAATTLGLVIVLITALAIVYRRQRPVSLPFALALLITVVLQGLLGAFTVWWLVKPLVVVLHLIGGLTTLSLLFWLWLDMRRRTGIVRPVPGTTRSATLDGARRAAVVATVVVAVQIALGGWTSSNYAAISCPDFPQCQAQWIPAGMDYADAFVLWRGLDINYTGGVLEHPARVAIHYTHRLGALAATLAVLLAAWLALRTAPTTLVRNGAWWAIGTLALQLLVGIFMVLEAFPLALATGHNGGAALLLLAMLMLNRRLREA